jgi:hypothetical protein
VKRVLVLFVLIASGVPAWAQQQPAAVEPKPHLDIYGFAMLDIGYNFTSINPNWFDTMRVSRLPTYEGQFGEDGSTYAGVRQSRLGFKGFTPTGLGELQTTFEFELFGTGVDEGQTTFRLRHAYGELGQFGAGQFWSPFSDTDVFPNSIEYFGPTGIAWFRNVQVRWTPIKKENRSLIVALERPGARGDQGIYDDRIELDGIHGRFPAPDVAIAYRAGQKWGHVRAAGLLRRIKWDDLQDDNVDLSGSATGWGLNLTGSVNAGKNDVIRGGFVFGEGIENAMNDSPIDIAIANNFGDPRRPVVGKPLPIVAMSLFLDHRWNERFTSAVGYSRQDIDNTDGQAPDAFKTGQYALGNLLYTPVPGVMVGGELQWGRRESFQEAFVADGLKIQFAFKYNFSATIGGN